MGRQGLLHDPPGGNIEDSLEAHIIDEQKSIQGNNNTINNNLQQTPPTNTKKKQSSILRFTTTQPTRKRENITDNITEEIENSHKRNIGEMQCNKNQKGRTGYALKT